MTKLTATFVSLFPDSIDSIVSSSIISRAVTNECLEIKKTQIRDFATDKHRTVDDTPYGGGPGQVMRVDVVANAIRASVDITHYAPDALPNKTCVILADPKGMLFTQEDAVRLAKYENLVFVCGRYEGIDARIENYVDESFSIGDYVLTGGELPSLVMLDAICRHVPGVLGNAESATVDSFTDGLLEHKQYTRPEIFEGHKVPDVLKSGHHEKIEIARFNEKINETKACRPDLYAQYLVMKSAKIQG